MPGATAVYGWPYPILGDSPNGAAQMQSLAQAVEGTVNGNNGRKTICVPQPGFTGPGTMTGGQTVTIGAYTITDPGWAYHIRMAGQLAWQQVNAAAIQTMGMHLSTQVDSTTYGTNMLGDSFQGNLTASNGTTMTNTVPTQNSTKITPGGYTGSHAVYLIAQAVGNTLSILTTNSLSSWMIEILPV